MPSPICTVNGTDASLGFVSVAASSTPTIALQNISGVKSWVVTCKSTDETTTAAAINGTISTNIVTKTATFSAPGPGGSALIFKSTVNGGVDAQGRTDPSLSTTFKVCVLTPLGYAVAAFDEQLEHDPANGYIPVLNEAIRNATNTAASAGDGLYYLGGAYNVGAGDGSIVVNPDSIQVGVLQSDASHGVRGGGTQHALATNATAGFMSAADKTLLSNATPLATPNTIMSRDANGDTAVVDLSAVTINCATVDALNTVTSGIAVYSPSIGSANSSISGSVSFRSGNSTTGSSGNTTYGSGDTSAGAGTTTGTVAMRSGSVVGGSGLSGSLEVATGSSLGAFGSGQVTVRSGSTTGSAASGQVAISSGTTTAAGTGQVTISSGSTTAVGKVTGAVVIKSGDCGTIASTTGAVSLKSGDAAGTSGSVTIATGTHTTVAAPGEIVIESATVSVASATTGAITVRTGANTAASATTGSIAVSTGNANQGSGSISYATGTSSASVSGGINITTGSSTRGLSVSNVQGSGAIVISTGTTISAKVLSGGVTISTGQSTSAPSGDVFITTGPGAPGTNDAGGVKIQPGNSTTDRSASVRIYGGSSSVAMAAGADRQAILLRGSDNNFVNAALPPIVIRGGDTTNGNYGGSVVLCAGQGPAGVNGSGIALGYYQASDANYQPANVSALFGGGRNILFLASALNVPSSNPTGGMHLWTDGKNLFCRNTDGTLKNITGLP